MNSENWNLDQSPPLIEGKSDSSNELIFCSARSDGPPAEAFYVIYRNESSQLQRVIHKLEESLVRLPRLHIFAHRSLIQSRRIRRLTSWAQQRSWLRILCIICLVLKGSSVRFSTALYPALHCAHHRETKEHIFESHDNCHVFLGLVLNRIRETSRLHLSLKSSFV